MCGIFGYLHKNEIPSLNINPDEFLNHRGPDDHGWLLYDGQQLLLGKSNLPQIPAKLFLLHKRLSILDLRSHAKQPMTCGQNRYYLIFNGEIYNYLELKQELFSLGVNFQTKSDSEVLLKAYAFWGTSCLQKLSGMFAFAIFDRYMGKLFMARDSFGIKPFYYHFDGERLIFASETKALLPFLAQVKVNPERLLYFLYSGLTDFGAHTLLSSIMSLPAGHYLEMDINTFQLSQSIPYWQPKIQEPLKISFKEAACELRKLFLHSIDLHLRSDVAVAATLSGGIDSSAIVSSIHHLYPSLNIHTFSYIADDKHINEEKWIDIVNNRVNASSHKVYADHNYLLDDLEKLIYMQDEPFGSTSIYAQHRIFQAASKTNLKVMLDGQGADEMLGGYTFYVLYRLISLLKRFRLKKAWNLFQGSQHNFNSHFLLKTLYSLLPHSWRNKMSYLLLQSPPKSEVMPFWLNADWFQLRNVECKNHKMRFDKPFLHEGLLQTLTTTSLPMLLRYEDRNSMAYSVESRVPFLTTKIVDFILSLPEEFIISNEGLSKAVFREAMKGIVPDSILTRRDKIGFATPERNWLLCLKPWIEKHLTSEYAKSLPFFNHSELLSDWNKMLVSKSNFDFRFWRWINLISWGQMNNVVFD